MSGSSARRHASRSCARESEQERLLSQRRGSSAIERPPLSDARCMSAPPLQAICPQHHLTPLSPPLTSPPSTRMQDVTSERMEAACSGGWDGLSVLVSELLGAGAWERTLVQLPDEWDEEEVPPHPPGEAPVNTDSPQLCSGDSEPHRRSEAE